MKIPVIDFPRNSVSEFEENYSSVFVDLMLFLMDLRALLSIRLTGYKESDGRSSRMVMGTIGLRQDIRKDSKYG